MATDALCAADWIETAEKADAQAAKLEGYADFLEAANRSERRRYQMTCAQALQTAGDARKSAHREREMAASARQMAESASQT